jgi:hypothetical protein
MEMEVDVRRERHDEYAGPPADTVTVRALRLPAPDLVRLAAPGGRVLVLGAAPDHHPLLRPVAGPPGAHVLERST